MAELSSLELGPIGHEFSAQALFGHRGVSREFPEKEGYRGGEAGSIIQVHSYTAVGSNPDCETLKPTFY